MKSKHNFLIALLIVALCSVSISFHCNHKRWVQRRSEIVQSPSKSLNILGHELNIVAVANCPKTLSHRPVFVSYAQIFEDLILYGVLGDVKNGFYIDVGANDPVADSVTKFFYEEGWHGINIEPLLREYSSLVVDRPRDINLCVCAGVRMGSWNCMREVGFQRSM